MRFRTINTLLLSVAFTVCGCFSHDNNLKSTVKRLTVSEQTFLAITNGLSLDVVVDTLGISAFHSFTVAGTNGTHTLISCHTAGDLSVFWLLFRDKRLIKIIVPFTLPGYLEKYPYQGTTATRIKPWAIDDVVIMDRHFPYDLLPATICRNNRIVIPESSGNRVTLLTGGSSQESPGVLPWKRSPS